MKKQELINAILTKIAEAAVEAREKRAATFPKQAGWLSGLGVAAGSTLRKMIPDSVKNFDYGGWMHNNPELAGAGIGGLGGAGLSTFTTAMRNRGKPESEQESILGNALTGGLAGAGLGAGAGTIYRASNVVDKGNEPPLVDEEVVKNLTPPSLAPGKNTVGGAIVGAVAQDVVGQNIHRKDLLEGLKSKNLSTVIDGKDPTGKEMLKALQGKQGPIHDPKTLDQMVNQRGGFSPLAAVQRGSLTRNGVTIGPHTPEQIANAKAFKLTLPEPPHVPATVIDQMAAQGRIARGSSTMGRIGARGGAFLLPTAAGWLMDQYARKNGLE